MIFAVVLACAGTPAPAPAVPTPVSGPAAPPAPLPAVAPPPAIFTPRTVYAACRARVEEPEGAGECATDADCTRAGCSSEVCVTRTAAVDLVTSCEVQDCFDVLDTCGCHEGACTWTLHVPPSLLRPVPGVTPSP